ncbi:HTH_Tnp_Tc3_2 domain-containing protein [Trichonephila clavipes]|nr:HTH_Tnp_Tc3_2 domain-containing protein [Trichonephila clavipes]
MAALVSEYTLEFFTLLNARGKKEMIEWCMKEGLIASSYECPKCNEQMGLNERTSVVWDGFEWRCRKKKKTAGWSTHHIAGQVDRSECAVRNCWQQWTQEGTHAWKTESGANRKTTRREDRRIVRQALVNPEVTRSTIRADVGVAIVPQTISRHLAEANLKSKRHFRALPLTPEHR